MLYVYSNDLYTYTKPINIYKKDILNLKKTNFIFFKTLNKIKKKF